MKYGSWTFVLSVCLCISRIQAGVIEETLTLEEGWNAIYLESTPEAEACADFFADLPVTRVGCYRSEAYADTMQFTSSGTTINQKPVSYYLWLKDHPAGSTFSHLTGGGTYLVYATNTATKTFLGTPCAPQMTWRVSSGKEGILNLAGVSIPAGTTIVASRYFGAGHPGSSASYWEVGGTGDAPEIYSLNVSSRAVKLSGGRAYAVSAAASGDWPGVLRVRGDGFSGGLDFSAGTDQATLMLANLTPTTRTVRVSQAASARMTDVAPALSVYLPATDAAPDTWTNFTARTYVLAPHETKSVTFFCDKTNLDRTRNHAAVVVVEDLSGSQLRVRIPVTVTPNPTVADEADYPAGLWIGRATLSQVSHGTNATPVAAGGKLPATILLHVDRAGKATLLQRVALAQESRASGGFRYMPYAELADVPSTCTASRVSSVLLDTANRAVPMSGSSVFGDAATFRFTVAEDSKENPFRHAWHPDHDGKSADFKSAAPSGDVPTNFIGPVKPESFSVTNTVTFTWRDAAGRVTFDHTPEESTYGRLDWKLEGLRADAPIHVRGVFVLQRISAAAAIRGGK